MSVSASTTVKPASIWRSKTFTMLLMSSFLLTVGNKIYEIVLPLIMYEITHSSVSMASMRTAELLPNLLFAVFIGVFVDRVNKKKWVLWMVGAQAVLLFALAYLFKTNNQALYLYYIAGFLLMTFNYGYFNAQVSLTKLSVPPSHLTSANAKFTFVETFVSVMGPALSGMIFLLADLSDGVLITAICYLLCLLFMFQLSVEESKAEKTKGHFWRDIQEGWITFKTNDLLWMVTIFVVFLNCTMTVVSTTIVFYAKDVLHLSSSLLAAVLSISGVGGLLGSLLINWLRPRIGLGKIFGMSAFLNGSAYIGLYFCTNLAVLSVSLFIIGFALSIHSTAVYTLRHEQTPGHLMGRIGGITGTIFRVACR
ncbi:MFS transporter [Aneurinibacillus tyrosinisolvens]|uniref:MFS transporter n=1 Tax=Aneurinibacillus tyrosinisolvens TaxID=1443435 RepID=UPI00069A2E9E|nr:MFS transporter [Aneurinibacillus tyrosinisolvens]